MKIKASLCFDMSYNTLKLLHMSQQELTSHSGSWALQMCLFQCAVRAKSTLGLIHWCLIVRGDRLHTGLIEQNDHSTAKRESMHRTITVINCNDRGWKWLFRGLWRGWIWRGRRAACRPLPPARVIVPMCSVPGRIPWGSVHTGGHLKAYLDVAAIRVRRSTQGSNLFQLLKRARGAEMGSYFCAGRGSYGFIWTRSWLVVRQKNMLTWLHTHAHAFPLLQFTS